MPNPPPPPRDPRQPAEFDPVATGRLLLRAGRVAALGTLDAANGFPATTLVTYATDLDGAPVLLVSGLSHHTKNLAGDARCSLLVSQGGKGDPLAHPRLTLQCVAERVEDAVIRRRFLARHPKAQLYVDFPDFSFFRLVSQRMMLNGGFARAFDGDAAHILSATPDRAAFAELEEGAVAHMNEDHAEALDLYAHHLAGQEGKGWRATGIDPDGLDLMRGDATARIPFAEPVTEGGALRKALMSLAKEARENTG